MYAARGDGLRAARPADRRLPQPARGLRGRHRPPDGRHEERQPRAPATSSTTGPTTPTRASSNLDTPEYANIDAHALVVLRARDRARDGAAAAGVGAAAERVGDAAARGLVDARRLPELGHGARLPPLALGPVLGVRAAGPAGDRRRRRAFWQDPRDGAWAKAMFDQSLELYHRLAVANDSVFAPRLMFGVDTRMKNDAFFRCADARRRRPRGRPGHGLAAVDHAAAAVRVRLRHGPPRDHHAALLDRDRPRRPRRPRLRRDRPRAAVRARPARRRRAPAGGRRARSGWSSTRRAAARCSPASARATARACGSCARPPGGSRARARTRRSRTPGRSRSSRRAARCRAARCASRPTTASGAPTIAARWQAGCRRDCPRLPRARALPDLGRGSTWSCATARACACTPASRATGSASRDVAQRRPRRLPHHPAQRAAGRDAVRRRGQARGDQPHARAEPGGAAHRQALLPSRLAGGAAQSPSGSPVSSSVLRSLRT